MYIFSDFVCLQTNIGVGMFSSLKVYILASKTASTRCIYQYPTNYRPTPRLRAVEYNITRLQVNPPHRRPALKILRRPTPKLPAFWESYGRVSATLRRIMKNMGKPSPKWPSTLLLQYFTWAIGQIKGRSRLV